MDDEGFLRGRQGKVLATIVVVLCGGAALYLGYTTWRGNAALAHANERVFIDSENMRSFTVDLSAADGMTIPMHSPYSGKDTAFPAELCYWTASGDPKKEATAVLLNNLIGKSGPTFCPDCGRLVVGHNPVPTPGASPPPTKDEWNKRHGTQRK